jgi:hypothetical protein
MAYHTCKSPSHPAKHGVPNHKPKRIRAKTTQSEYATGRANALLEGAVKVGTRTCSN